MIGYSNNRCCSAYMPYKILFYAKEFKAVRNLGPEYIS